MRSRLRVAPGCTLFLISLSLAVAGSLGGISGRGDSPVELLARLICFKTVSSGDAPNHVLDPDEFAAAHRLLRTSFPGVYRSLEVEEVANHSLLFTWGGRDGAAPPIALLSHQDVVPAEEGPQSPWTKPPFAGIIEDGWIYGRGAIDTKFSLVAILQAAEELLKEGFVPRRTIYFAFGHDEEVGGSCGAAKIAERLAARGVELDFLIDEGGQVLTDGIPLITTRPVALIATAEKGFESVNVSIHATGGHSSQPPIDGSSVLEVMGRILVNVSTHPPPLRLVEPVPSMLRALAPGVSSPFQRFLFEHSEDHQVAPILMRSLADMDASTAALVRTTVAATITRAGMQDNVLPESGTVVFNFRKLPGEDPAFPEAYLKEQIGSDLPKVVIQSSSDPVDASTTPSHGPAWELISRAVNETFSQFQGLMAAPNLLTGATDSTHYSNITRNGIFRFSGLAMSIADISRIHGIDERVKADHVLLGVKFFKRVMQLAAG